MKLKVFERGIDVSQTRQGGDGAKGVGCVTGVTTLKPFFRKVPPKRPFQQPVRT
jgi:hypothetical protein